MRYFIYLHRRPDTGEVFYVGRGLVRARGNPVGRAHDKNDRSPQWKSIVTRNGGNYEVEIAEWFPTQELANEAERLYIARFGRKCNGGTLVNFTDGGDGAEGYRHNEASRERMRAAHAERPERGRRLNAAATPESRRRGGSRGMTGRHHMPETVASYSEARRGGKNAQAKALVDTATGAEYACVGDAAAAFGIPRGTLYQYLWGKRAANKTTLRYK